MKSLHLQGLEKPVSQIVFGTAHLRDTDAHIRLLEAIYELGCITFDTARVYTNGEAERCLGRWLRNRKTSREITIITKCGHPDQHGSRLRTADLVLDVEQSLRVLGIDAIDLLLLHRDDVSVPIDLILTNLNRLHTQGKIHAFGVSNWSHLRIRDAETLAAQHNVRPISASSVHFSLGQWNCAPWPGCWSIAGPEKALERKWYEETRLPLLAWSSLAAGFFAADTDDASGNEKITKRVSDVYSSRDNKRRLERARELAKHKGLNTPQIALAYVLNQKMNVLPVISTMDPAHFKANLRAVEVSLSPLELRWLALESDDFV